MIIHLKFWIINVHFQACKMGVGYCASVDINASDYIQQSQIAGKEHEKSTVWAHVVRLTFGTIEREKNRKV